MSDTPAMSDSPSARQTPAPGDPPDSTRSHNLLVGAVFIGACILYGLTCAPGVLWQDSAMFQHRVWFFDVRGESGLPLAHPLYILSARAFTLAIPFGDFAWRVNMFSALCGAAAVAVAMRLLLNLTRSPAAALVGTLSLAVSHTFWTHCAIAEVYNLYALGLVVELWCIERWMHTRRWTWLAMAILVNGLNLSNHLLAILHWPVYLGLLIWAIRSGMLRAKHLTGLVLALIAGSSPYLWLIGENISVGQGVVAALKESLVGPEERSSKVLSTDFSFARQAGRSALYFAMNFPTPVVVLAALGFWKWAGTPGKRWFALTAGAIFAINSVFAFRYPVPDQFVFFTPAYVIVALLIGIGAADMLNRRRDSSPSDPRVRQVTKLAIVAALLPIVVYAAAPSVFRMTGFSIGAKRDIPFRDTLAYFIQPWKTGDDSARRFADAAFEVAAPDGLLYADTTIKNVLVYVRDVQGKAPGVTLTTGHDTIPRPPAINREPQAVEPFVNAGKAFICTDAAEYIPDWIREQWKLEPAGIIFRILPIRQP